MAFHFHKLVINDVRKETNDCISIAFDIPAHLAKEFIFKPGQNITIKKIIAGEEIRRSYSICTSPPEGELRIAIKNISNGIFSSYANKELSAGDVLEVLPPSGSFFTEVNAANKKEYTFFAAGSGITPIISLIKTILPAEPESLATLVFGNKTIGSVIFKEQLQALKDVYLSRFKVYYIFSKEHTDAPVNYGRIDTAKCVQLSALIDFSKVDEFFICGPEQMIFCVKDFLEKAGVQGNIHFELFTTPLAKSMLEVSTAGSDNINGSEITVKVDGRSFNFKLQQNAENLLDAALALGADLPFSCKSGVCTTCKAMLTEGKIVMEVNYGLEPDEVKRGFILTCQSHPVSEKVTVDFDIK